MKLTALLAVILLSQPLVFGQDTTATRSVTGQKQAAHAAVVINQIDTSAYPRVTILTLVPKLRVWERVLSGRSSASR